MNRSERGRVFELLTAGRGGWLGRAIDGFVTVLILCNVLAVMLETVNPLRVQYAEAFEAFAYFSIAVLTIEYVLRVWAATAIDEYAGPLTGRLRFMARPYPLLDLLAIAPLYVGAIIVGPQFLLSFRLIWLLLFLRLARRSKAMRTLRGAVRAKREDLAVAFFGAGVLLVLASSLLYYAERGAQPETFSSIPAALWWGVITLTTVGYGDVVPVTPLGQLLAGLTAVGGIAFFALPASILASGFIELRETEPKPNTCPHCGRALDTGDHELLDERTERATK